MVSFWPFKGDNTSTADFEKTLAALTEKLQKANARDTLLRTRSRRLKALWTLYTSFIYILYTLILVLVTGYQRWGAPEYTAVAGGPVVVYLVRTALATYYDYRLSTNRAYIKSVSTQRKQAIDKFKSATKYDSTQQLLAKYGDEQPQPSGPKKNATDKNEDKPQEPPKPLPPRTNLPPPPTANIQRGPPAPNMQIQPPAPGTGPSQAAPSMPDPRQGALVPGTPASPDATSPAFAPPAAQYVAAPAQPQWYDRILDVLLGDDETKPINRLALICEHCRLVNGQAPPGVKQLADVGRWRCGGCKKWNGQETEVQKIMEEVGSVADALVPTAEEDEAAAATDEATADAASTPARATRSKTAQASAADT